MILKNIDILNFKNIGEASIEFSQGVNCLLGLNGMGKSNLLDAIHFLSVTRPMATLPENLLIRHNEEAMLVKGTYITDSNGEDTISCGIQRGKAKRLKRNGKEYRRFSEHIGRYPIVSATPSDIRLVNGSGEERRKLMDMVLSQAQPIYLTSLMRYNKALESRNKMLRAGIRDSILYDSVETVMCEAASLIHSIRREWTQSLAPAMQEIYRRLSGSQEETYIAYSSKLNEQGMKELLDSQRAKDTVLGFTSAGVHRDDIEATLDGYPLRRIGSQGQLKTFTIALRFAIFHYIRETSGAMPILLLDDIFDKLDASRVENIMTEVTVPDRFGQIFLTDTNRKHLDDIMLGINGDKTLLNVQAGVFTPINA